MEIRKNPGEPHELPTTMYVYKQTSKHSAIEKNRELQPILKATFLPYKWAFMKKKKIDRINSQVKEAKI